ncbi:DUF3299 domain-containing protein [Pseudooceanicola algae]|uniref:DUF3299 domain-containing protein n=1 Tax=Pseudooceanicola algae TaxID=1537215 RepID=UPI001E4C753E|nr:DUF3299 domain-containing protein [Pseudooceanicola algae]
MAKALREITWDDLIPPGVPYSEIVGEGNLDAVNDTWNPIFDQNGSKMNTKLDGQRIRMPGYMIPLESGSSGISEFILVPYVGACIHVPPPPPNQLVFVTSATPWPRDQLWEAIWVTGTMSVKMQYTSLGDIGYEVAADSLEPYEW